jgi:biopolymer transport protein TolR
MALSFEKNNRKKRIISDINITPFVDVLLVLLIIFMVTAPMLTNSVNLDLPDGASNKISEKDQTITVSIRQDMSIFLQENQIKLQDLAPSILKLADNNFSSKVYVRADKNLDYGNVMNVVKTINSAGFRQISLITEAK